MQRVTYNRQALNSVDTLKSTKRQKLFSMLVLFFFRAFVKIIYTLMPILI